MRAWMHKTILLFTVLITVTPIFSQIHVSSTKQDSLLRLNISLDKGWWLYEKAKGIESPKLFSKEANIKIASFLIKQPVTIQNDPSLEQSVAVHTGTMEATAILVKKAEAAVIDLHFTGSISNGEYFLPVDTILRIQNAVLSKQQTRIRIPGMQLKTAAGEIAAESSSSPLKIFFLGLLGGLIALLTPCVFPMVPITVSFFTTKSRSRAHAVRMAVLYGASIVLIYLLVSLPFHLFRIRPESLNNLATSVPLNIIFFVVFTLFALSFFGAFNITLPNSFANKAEGKKGTATIAGIFFLALTLVIVSFSCTGPILGTLLAGTASDGAWLLTVGCFGFGLALGIPFMLLAIFPGWLSKLPRSGSWLTKVKVSLAFVELALALKFLSNADLVQQWGLIKREVFIALWMVIGISWICYLINIRWMLRYGKYNAPAGSSVFALMLLLLVGYLGTGLSGRSLSLVSGFTPPVFYSIKPVTTTRLEANLINDYEGALELAKQQNKSLLIDFTGWACVNCRKMEEQVWTDPAVSEYIREHYILVSLYVDDKKLLPAVQQIFDFIAKDGSKKDIRSIGDRYAAMQAENLHQVSQPLYAVVNTNEVLQQAPVGYTPNATTFLNWLKSNNHAK